MKKILIVILALVFIIVGYYSIEKDKNVEDIVPESNIGEENNGDDVEEVDIEEFDIAIGKEAPDFTLKDLDGEDVSLSDYRGKIVLINFWATWCKWCDVEMPDLQKLDNENDDLVVLAVDVMEDKATVQKYIEKGNYDFQVVLDEYEEVSKTYLVSGYPTSYFVDKDGILLGGVPGMMTYEQMILILEDIRGE